MRDSITISSDEITRVTYCHMLMISIVFWATANVVSKKSWMAPANHTSCLGLPWIGGAVTGSLCYSLLKCRFDRAPRSSTCNLSNKRHQRNHVKCDVTRPSDPAHVLNQSCVGICTSPCSFNIPKLSQEMQDAVRFYRDTESIAALCCLV